MAKRFTDTEKWTEWYRALPWEYRCLWELINDKCDLVGVWKVDLSLAQFNIGAPVNLATALTLFGPRVRETNPGTWYLPDFVPFQYGELSDSSHFHRSLKVALERQGIDTLSTPCRHPVDRPKRPIEQPVAAETLTLRRINVNTKITTEHLDKDFVSLWERYPKKLGRKAAERHFNASVKTDKDRLDIQNALDNYIARIKKEGIADPYIQHGSTWFNNWQDDIGYRGTTLPKMPAAPPKPVEVPPDYTQDEVDQFHRETVAKLGSCWAKDCRVCKKAVA